MRKKLVTYKGTPFKKKRELIFQQKLYTGQNGMELYQSADGKTKTKTKTYNQEYFTWQDYHSEWKERESYRQAKSKGVCHYLNGPNKKSYRDFFKQKRKIYSQR